MKIPSGKLIKRYVAEGRNFKLITDELVQQHFYGYLETSGLVDDIPSKGYLVFENGIPIVAYYGHTDYVDWKYAIKSIYDDVTFGYADVSIYELPSSKIDAFKRFISCVNKPDEDAVAIEIQRLTKDEKRCPKWNSMLKESSCNVCKEQCTLSVADPDHFIAKKFIKNFEMIHQNRIRMEKSSIKGDESIGSKLSGDTDVQESKLISDLKRIKQVTEKKESESKSGGDLKPIKQVIEKRESESKSGGGLKPIKQIIEKKESEAILVVAPTSDTDSEKELEEAMRVTEEYMVESIATFKKQSRGILESLGLEHLIEENDSETILVVAPTSDTDNEKELEEAMRVTEEYMVESIATFKKQSRGILESLGLEHLIDETVDA